MKRMEKLGSNKNTEMPRGAWAFHGLMCTKVSINFV
jgi:hypothetical protein